MNVCEFNLDNEHLSFVEDIEEDAQVIKRSFHLHNNITCMVYRIWKRVSFVFHHPVQMCVCRYLSKSRNKICFL